MHIEGKCVSVHLNNPFMFREIGCVEVVLQHFHRRCLRAARYGS
jgi:hypothetical protein